MQHSVTITGTEQEILAVLCRIAGVENPATSGGKTTTSPASSDKVYTSKELIDMDFGTLKRVASDLNIDLAGKKSAGLRKAILAAQEDVEDEDEDVEDEDEDWDDEDEDDEDEDDEDEDEEPEPAPVKRGPGRPRKTPVAAPAPAKRPVGRPRTRAR